MTQQVLTTATSAPPSCSTWPAASSRSRTACASACDTLQPRKSTEKLAIRCWTLPRPDVQVGGPTLGLAPALSPVAGELRRLRRQVAGDDDPVAFEALRDRPVDVERHVDDRGVGRRQRLGERVRLPDVDRTWFAAAFRSVASTASGSRSIASTGPKPSLAAAIERTPDPHPTSSRLPRGDSRSSSRQRRVVACAPVPNARPGSITTAIASGFGLLPGRPHPQRPDPDGPVEGAPALLPASLDLVRTCAAERRPQPLLPARVGVGDELDAVGAVLLLEALGEELEHDRAGALGLGRRNADGDAEKGQVGAHAAL